MENEKKPVDKKQAKNKKDNNDALVKNTIELSPRLNEAKGQTAVVGWGRMNPITSGHEIVANTIKTVARKEGGVPMIFLTHSQDKKKNPLQYDDKVALAQKAFGPIIKRSNSKTIIQVMQELQKKYSNVLMVVGADRVQEFDTLLNKYNGKDYKFDSIRIVSAGNRADPDSDAAKDLSAKNMSASVMRKLAAEGDMESFKKGLPKKLMKDAEDVYDMVRAGMQLAEELEMLGEALDYGQRRKRAQVMRRYKTKIAAARKRMAKRRASTEKLKQRARKKAISAVRQKVAGAKGKNYAELSPGEKIMIDKKVEKRKAIIDRIAKKLLPSVRKAELQRLSGTKKMNEEFENLLIDDAFDDLMEGTKTPQDGEIADRKGTQPSRYHAGLSKSTKEKRDAQFKKQAKMSDDNPDAYKPAPGDKTAKTKPSVHTKRFHQMFSKESTVKADRRFKINRKVAEETELTRLGKEHERERDSLEQQQKLEKKRTQIRQLRRDIQQKEEFTDVELAMFIEEVAMSVELEEAKSMEGLKKKSEKSGISYGTLKKVYNRGVAAWKTGHRPGTTPQQWGYARVNAFITKKKAGNLNHDKDLANSYEPEGVMLDEGLNDPSIFKAVFLAGGPGSGKSFIVGKTALTSLGMKVINSDDAFENALKKAGMEPTPENIFTDKGQEIRKGAVAITGKKQKIAIDGRLGLVIDGTGKDYEKISRQAGELRKLGYEVAMIFVNTDLETAQSRNQARQRTLPADKVKQMWDQVQSNIGKFQNFFSSNMFIIDNSEGADFERDVLRTYKKISAWAKKAPSKPAAKNWISKAKKERGIKEAVEENEPMCSDKCCGMPVSQCKCGPDCPNCDCHEKNKLNESFEIIVDISEGPLLYRRQYDHALDALKKVIDRKKKEAGGKMRHSSNYYAAQIARSYKDVDGRKLAKMLPEEYVFEAGAGEWGTDKLAKRYKKDTPGQMEEEVSQKQIGDLEKFADRLLDKFGVDVEFTRHFADRMNDERNSPKISIAELQRFFKKIAKNKAKDIKANADSEAVLKDMQQDLNLPVVINFDRDSEEFEVVNKTIMRKKNFSTSNKVIKY